MSDSAKANLSKMVHTYRRDSDDITGAMRMSAIETIVMEQMPGGRFQIFARTTSSDAGFVTPVQHNLGMGQYMLAAMQRYLGGEGDDPIAAEAAAAAARAAEAANEAAPAGN